MEALSPLEKKLLIELQKNDGKIKPEKIDMELVKVMNAAAWLQSKGLVKTSENIIKEYEITEEGEKFLKEGLPEKRILKDVEKIEIETLEKKFGKKDVSISIGWALRKGWCRIEKNEKNYLIITEKGKEEIKKKQPEEEALEKLQKRILTSTKKS